eukprot:2054801-Pyramimonas_sp.AAC.1
MRPQQLKVSKAIAHAKLKTLSPGSAEEQRAANILAFQCRVARVASAWSRRSCGRASGQREDGEAEGRGGQHHSRRLAFKI